jgi:hypothetical protein
MAEHQTNQSPSHNKKHQADEIKSHRQMEQSLLFRVESY